MGDRILLPVENQENASEAVALARDLFETGTFVLLHVIDPADPGDSLDSPVPTLSHVWYEQRTEYADSLLDELAQQAGDGTIEIERHIVPGNTVTEILTTIEAENIDHVVMGHHDRQGISRFLLGSTVDPVVRRSPVPVTVVRSDGEDSLKN